LNFKTYSNQPGTSRSLNGIQNDDDDDDSFFINNDLEQDDVGLERSASTWDVNNGLHDEFRNNLQGHISDRSRNKLFNCQWKIYKRDNLIPTFQHYKVGQELEVKISSIDNHEQFYVQEVSTLENLKRSELLINRYVSKVIEELKIDIALRDKFLAHQENTTQYDVVLAQSKANGKWRRAILLEKISSSHFDYADNMDQIIITDMTVKRQEKNYFTLIFIDSGKKVTVVRSLDDKSLFILPINEMILHGSYCLKCSLNDANIRVKGKYGLSQIENRMSFEKKFKEVLLYKKVFIKISSTTRVSNDFVAMVDLYFKPNEGEELLEKLNATLDASCLNSIDNSTISLVSKDLKVNCGSYLVRLIMAELNEINEHQVFEIYKFNSLY
jgi:hypothetical protein